MSNGRARKSASVREAGAHQETTGCVEVAAHVPTNVAPEMTVGLTCAAGVDIVGHGHCVCTDDESMDTVSCDSDKDCIESAVLDAAKCGGT